MVMNDKRSPAGFWSVIVPRLHNTGRFSKQYPFSLFFSIWDLRFLYSFQYGTSRNLKLIYFLPMAPTSKISKLLVLTYNQILFTTTSVIIYRNNASLSTFRKYRRNWSLILNLFTYISENLL